MKSHKPLRIIITAGPTREYIDPVRFISNRSTGHMGYAIARVACKRKHTVMLYSGPTHLKTPAGVRRYNFETALELNRMMRKAFPGVDAAICTAAIGDYRVSPIKLKKLKKEKKIINLELRPNPDILKMMGKLKTREVLVGFALETDNLLQNAQKKMLKKNLDFIVANQVTRAKEPFGPGRTTAVIIDQKSREECADITKAKLAGIILDKIEHICYIY